MPICNMRANAGQFPFRTRRLIDATEIWMHRSITRKQRTECVGKEEVLRKMGTEKDMCSYDQKEFIFLKHIVWKKP